MIGDLAIAVALHILGIPFQIAGYFILLAILAIPASLITVGRKLVKPGATFGDLFESSFAFIMFLYLLGIPITYYFFWGWGMFVRALAQGAFAEALLVCFICPLVPFSLMVVLGLILERLDFRQLRSPHAL